MRRFAVQALILTVGLASCRSRGPAEEVPPEVVEPTPGSGETTESESSRPGDALIDAHSHLIGTEAWPAIEATLDEQNIAYILNLSGGSPRRGMTEALALSELSDGRILNAMTINWDGLDEVAFGEILAEELSLCVERYGYVALKVSKALGLFVPDADGGLLDVDDPRLYPLWERAGQLGVPVFIHTGDPRAFWEPVTSDNERYDELSAHPSWSFHGPEFPPRDELLAERDHLLELFPDTTFVGVHFANNPEDLDYVEATLARYPNFYVDIGARIPEIGRHDPERVRELFERFSDRILFATDIVIAYSERSEELFFQLGSVGEEPDTFDEIPEFYRRHRQWLETNDRGMAHPTPIQGNWTVDAIGLSDEVLDAVYYENAARLFGIVPTR